MEYEILLKNTGGFGRLQVVMLLLFGVLCFKAMCELQLFVLMQSQPLYRCAQQNTSGYDPQEYAAHCEITRYFNESTGGNYTESCKNFQYRQVYFKKTLIEEYDMICDRSIYATVMTSMYFLGHALGILLSTLGDRIGRKALFYGAGALDILTTLLPVFMPTVETQILSRFLIGIPTPIFSQGLLLLYELTMQEHRGLVGNFYWLFWCAGYMSSAILAYLLQDWRRIQLVSCAFCISYPFIYLFVPESPRWLVLRGRTEDAKKVFSQLARWNGVQWTPDENFDVNIEAEPTGRVQELFQFSQMRKKTLICFWMMLVLSLCYYGLSIDSSFITENIFINTAISGALEIPSYLIAAPLCNLLGRRWPTITSTAVSGACIIVSAFQAYGVAKQDATNDSLLNHEHSCCRIVSNFRTQYWHVFNALLLSALLTTISPVIGSLATIEPWLPGLLFGGLAAISSVLIYVLPETSGLPLPETVEQSETLYHGSETVWLKSCNNTRQNRSSIKKDA
uniref:MFS domain-containing protein n=1 Tax=Macrostomum lignano TaxID=282301 RepID=A0A1I8JDE7_9PLAT